MPALETPMLSLEATLIDRLIVDIDEVLTTQVAAITSHPEFVKLRDLWFGLGQLVVVTDTLDFCEVEVLPASREDLENDFDDHPDLTTSGLWDQLYVKEYDQAGGQPYDAILMQWSFNHHRPDIRFLKKLSQIAAACHCPIITNPAPSLFQIDNFSKLEEIRSLSTLFDGMDYKRWRSLRQSVDCRYLSMTLPGHYLQITSPKPLPRWCRDPRLAGAYRAKIAGSKLFGILLARSFHHYGWCVQIRGPRTGGGLPIPEAKKLAIPGLHLNESTAELSFSDARERDFADQGFIVLNYYRLTQKPCVFSAPTLQMVPAVNADGDDRLAASLPYVLLISRIAHYQRVIQRENVGTVKDAKVLEKELQDWMEQYITRAVYPDQVQRARKPLRDGSKVEIQDDESNPGFFAVKLIISPHIQLEGVCARLTLVSKMPKLED